MTHRQRGESALADHLACIRADRGYLVAGHRSLEEYAGRRLGLSQRQMYYLLALHRTLERLAALRRAFLAGRLTVRQALLVGRVASRETAEPWIRRAETITLRRLEDEVEYWELLRDERPEVWERLRGGPLPEGIVLVPGHDPRLRESRLHGSAPSPAPGQVAEAGNGQVQDGGGGSETDLHMSAHGEPVDARAFLAALQASETRTPLPRRMGTLRLRVDAELRAQWRSLVSRLRAACDGPLEEWEALALALRRFWQVWDNTETRRQRRENPTLERDGWRCTAPGCRSVGSGRLHEHHIVFRSAGGALSDPANLTTLCTAHHERLLHQGLIRCRGTAPDNLRWELGITDELPAFLIFDSDRRIEGSATPVHDQQRSTVQQHTLASVTPLPQ